MNLGLSETAMKQYKGTKYLTLNTEQVEQLKDRMKFPEKEKLVQSLIMLKISHGELK